jgi:group I intron endonuclease
MNKIYYLYKITNTTNGKIYIGQSVNPKSRWYAHKRSSRNPQLPIYYAMAKYGIECFNFEVISCCKTLEDANETETELVKQYDSFISDGYGYNATRGGMNCPKSEVWKQIMKKYREDPDYQKKISEKQSRAWANNSDRKQKLSTSSKLMWQDEAYKNNMLKIIEPTQFKVGHEVSDHTRKRVAESTRGRSPVTKGTKGVMKPNKTSFKNGENTGDKNKNSKLNWEIVDQIRNDQVDGMNLDQLSQKYTMVSRSTIYNVIAQKTWKR